ncbi:MAG: hypothetical protein P4L31_04995 [Candidatus Babeliales bacterium]|nr:hypothetical protein [Candidatus Babeliales bacterium]
MLNKKITFAILLLAGMNQIASAGMITVSGAGISAHGDSVSVSCAAFSGSTFTVKSGTSITLPECTSWTVTNQRTGVKKTGIKAGDVVSFTSGSAGGSLG